MVCLCNVFTFSSNESVYAPKAQLLDLLEDGVKSINTPKPSVSIEAIEKTFQKGYLRLERRQKLRRQDRQICCKALHSSRKVIIRLISQLPFHDLRRQHKRNPRNKLSLSTSRKLVVVYSIADSIIYYCELDPFFCNISESLRQKYCSIVML